MRVIVMELARITDHIICNTIIGQDAGATTPFLYVLPVAREDLRDL
jgi:NADH-quinone oxidoreductase subunit D